MKRRLVAIASPALLAAVALPAASANAASRPWTCEDGGHTLTTTIYYTGNTTTHTWEKLTYRLTGSGTGGKSNWNASFDDGTGTRNYAAAQQDDLDQDVLYTHNFVNFNSAKSRTETWRAWAAFDTAGTDNHCASSTIF